MRTRSAWNCFAAWVRRALLRWGSVEPAREILIADGVLENLSLMARSAHPKEMLAFLASTDGVRNGRILIDELHLQAYEASEDSATVWLHQLPPVTGIVGTAHSHPGGSRRPSDADLHLWSKYGFLHAIIPEPYRPEDVVFYDKSGRRIGVTVLASAANG